MITSDELTERHLGAVQAMVYTMVLDKTVAEGIPQRVFLSQDDGTEYEVYQTVAPLQTKGNS